MTGEHRRRKADTRGIALARRDGLSDGARAAAATALAKAADVLGDVRGCVVSGFWPIRGEIDPRSLMARLEDRGAMLALPVMIDRETLEFRRWRAGQNLHAAKFGVMEPGPDAAMVEPGVMLVPLAAFDDGFNRIGYGAGFYDRAIARLTKLGRRPRLVGLAFDCQRADVVPTEPHDEPLDMIITETGVLERKPNGSDP